MIFNQLLLFISCTLTSVACHQGQEYTKYYSNEWIVRMEGGQQVAQLLSLQMGYHLIGEVTGFPDTYRMTKLDHPIKHKRGDVRLTQRLAQDARVVWAEQQFAKRRQKRDLLDTKKNKQLPDDDTGDSRVSREVLVRVKRDSMNDLEFEFGKASSLRFNDELWDQQWYMQDTRTRSDLPKLDLHVLPCYDMGITGKGVRVSILDDGIEYVHRDLYENYDPDISFDANDLDKDPAPRYDEKRSNAHGTRCAGEVAMKANNGVCGVGIAYNAKIGGVRLLDGPVDDRVEGIALGYAYDKVDIYSASWGPNDDGKTVEGPGRLAVEAIERGVTKGRNGKGVIFVWAGGNGGGKNDNCNCDGYTASIYTLSIGSASQQGSFPWYGEMCAATLATTYSSGAYYDQMIATTDLRGTCTIKHTGTSASAPLAAGIIALALEANPSLTWRDVQHLVASTSEYAPLVDNVGWIKNAAGYWVNTRFGFGLMDAYGLVKAALNWTTVPEKYVCQIEGTRVSENSSLTSGEQLSISFSTDSCVHPINYLEHVEMEINVEYSVRGALEVDLMSAAGTEIQLLTAREHDKSNRGFNNWRLMSVLTWNENPNGVWVATVSDNSITTENSGRIGNWTLFIHGTQEMPAYLKSGPRVYDYDYNRVHRKSGPPSVSPTSVSKLKEEKGREVEWGDLVGLQLAVRALQHRYPNKGTKWWSDMLNAAHSK